MSSQTIFEKLAKTLVEIYDGPLFGLIGDANLFLVNAYRQKYQGRYIAASHESAAVMMAVGYSRRANRVGLATITHGPALTNALTALVEASKVNVPLVVLVGDTDKVDRGHPQIIDQLRLLGALDIEVVNMRSAESAVVDLTRAFRRAIIGNRPIVFNMPVQMQWREIDTRVAEKAQLYFPSDETYLGSGDDMDRAVGIIASARYPIIIGGRGIGSCEEEERVLELARRIGAPVCTTVRGKGLFDGDPWNLGICGTLSEGRTLEELNKADCIIAIGASLNQYTTSFGSLIRRKRVIHIDKRRSVIGEFVDVDAGLIGSISKTINEVLKWLDVAEIESRGCRTEDLAEQVGAQRHTYDAVRELVRNEYEHNGRRLGLRSSLRFLNKILDKERTIVTDTGRFLSSVWRELEVHKRGKLIDTIGFAAIGLGAGAATGAALASGGETTVFVVGDGGLFLSGLSELATMKRYGLDIICVVCNDGGYGAEKVQFEDRDIDTDIAEIPKMPLVDVASAMGVEGWEVGTPAELLECERRLRERQKNGPFIIDLIVDPDSIMRLG